ncbi:MAG: FKBP-type peptidyl-prolyl cis-trans isomerase [Planctomycetota bacterium]
MTNIKTTLLLIVIAVVLGVAAIFAVPSSVDPESFNDQGEIFFPEFTDPLACKEIEVYEPNAETATVDIFSVKFEDGLWKIPSHNGYPADAKDRMALAATSLIGLKKDSIRSARIEDRAAFGVEDPIDDASSVEGRGKRIVMKDASGRTLADVILGKKVEENRDMSDMYRQPKDWAYIREPDKKRIYAVNLKPTPESYGETLNDISTTFKDWIDTDLLRVESREIKGVQLLNYKVDEETRSVDEGDTLVLTQGEEDKWAIEGLAEEEQVKESNVTSMLRALDNLEIVGVRQAPEQMDPRSMVSGLSMVNKGFFFGNEGNLYGNEGQMKLHTDAGVNYDLYFGEMFLGSGKEVTAGTGEGSEEPKEDGKMVPTENRYLFVKVELDPDLEKQAKAAAAAFEAEKTAKASKEESAEGETPEAGEDKKAPEKSEAEKENEKAQKKLEDAKKRIEELNLGFKKWFYVITNDSFNELRKTRKDLVELKLPDTSAIGEQPEEKKEPVKRPSGLAYIDLKRGSGARAKDGDTLKILYTGWLTDGTVFDSNIDRDNPFTMKLGENQVIKGWEEGLAGMNPGSRRKLIIPPDLGYGDSGRGEKIPGGATLIFDVELLEITGK